MSMRVVSRALAIVLSAAGLAACSGPTTRVLRDADPIVAQEQREQALAAGSAWSLRGKIAVSDGRDGGSGRIEWHQQGDEFRIEIRAPVSRRTWRLTQSGGVATLEGLDEGTRRGADAEALLRDAVGWSLPVADLVAWARGLRGRDDARIEFDATQLPRRIDQDGWMIEYRAWDAGEPPLPTKIFASRGQQRVRLVVEQWDGAR